MNTKALKISTAICALILVVGVAGVLLEKNRSINLVVKKDGIKEIDWKNRSYKGGDIFVDPVILTNGKFIDYVSDHEVWLDAVNYLDINSDGSLDAIVGIYDVYCGASCHSSKSYFIYSMGKNGRLDLLSVISARNPISDKVDGNKLVIVSGKIAESDPWNMPSMASTAVYGYENGAIKLISESTEDYQAAEWREETLRVDALFESMPENVKAMTIEYNNLNGDCRGSVNPESKEAVNACDKREAVVENLQKLGWCRSDKAGRGGEIELCKTPSVFSIKTNSSYLYCDPMESKTVDDELSARLAYDKTVTVAVAPGNLNNLKGYVSGIEYPEMGNVFLFGGSSEQCDVFAKTLSERYKSKSETTLFSISAGGRVQEVTFPGTDSLKRKLADLRVSKLDRNQFAGADDGVVSLIYKYVQNECQGSQAGSDAEYKAACNENEKQYAQINKLGWCYNETSNNAWTECLVYAGESVDYGKFYALARTGMTIGKRYRFNANLSELCMESKSNNTQSLCSLDLSSFDDDSEKMRWLEGGAQYSGTIVAEMTYGGAISIKRLVGIPGKKDYGKNARIAAELSASASREKTTIPPYTGGFRGN